MRKVFLFLLLLWGVGYGYPPMPRSQDEEEDLFVRRIVKFWRDHDFDLAKFQIQTYLQTHKNSPFEEHFLAMLGDIHLHQKKYEEALSYYEKIRSSEMQNEVLTKRFQALYLLERFPELYREAKNRFSTLTNEGKFYFAESCFREGILLFPLEEGKNEALLLFNEALLLYQSIQSDETYKNFAKLATAEIFRITGNHEAAATLYLELGAEKKDPKVLFHAALMLQNIDEKKAASIFETLAKEGHKKAALYWMQALAKDKNWREITANRELFLSNNEDEETQSIAYFYLGVASFEEKNHLQVVLDLTKSLGKNLTPPLDRTALLLLMNSAKEIGRTEASEKCFALIKERYPNDTPEGLFLLALSYTKGNDKLKALTTLNEFLTLYSNHPQAENALFEKIRLLAKLEDWKNARENISLFFEKYPYSSLRPKMLSFSVNLSLTRLGIDNVYQDLADDLEKGLEWKAFADDKEKKLLLAKTYLKLERPDDALKILIDGLEDPLLLTECYVMKNEWENIVLFGEKALEQHPELKPLHLQLFNAYHALYLRDKETEMQEMAIFHLNEIIDLYSVSIENRIWLAHYMAKQEPKRAIFLLESLLQTDDTLKKYHEEALLLADLYRKEKNSEKILSLLERMIAVDDSKDPSIELFLADQYFLKGNVSQANEIYKRLELSANPAIAAKAKLQNARLELSEEPEKGLRDLYELAVERILATEPIHLEAALDYAEGKAHIANPKVQDVVLLENLLQVKEDFTSKETAKGKEYHACREKFPEKEKIYQAYMRYLDARIYLLQSKFSVDPIEKKNKEHAAKALLSTLRQGKYAVSDYLVEKAREKLHE